MNVHRFSLVGAGFQRSTASDGLGTASEDLSLLDSACPQVVANRLAHDFPGGHALFFRPMLDSFTQRKCVTVNLL